MPLLQAERVSVDFGGLRAVNEVDLTADEGAVTGLIGPNGAGKTTTFNALCGLQPVTEGRVFIDGTDVGGMKTHERARLGMARTFQRLEVFGSLTARENVLVAAEIHRRWSGIRTDAEAIADETLARIGLERYADRRVDVLPTGTARLVEIARALSIRPRLMLLDEPSSGLSDTESDFLAELLERLAGEGLAILLVEHDVGLVMRVCARIHVLDFGRLIAVGTAADVRANEAVQAAYLGVPAEVAG